MNLSSLARLSVARAARRRSLDLRATRDALPARLLATLALLFGSTAAPAWGHPEAPGAPQTRPIAIVGATIHVVSGPALENATVLFDQGRLVAVGKHVALPKGTLQIDGRGKHVYPSLMDSSSNIGLVEINSVRATRDEGEVGELNPNVRAETAVNPDSELIPVTRSNGVLLAVAAPNGGMVSGRAAVMQMDGWTWEQMTLKGDAALVIHWPRLPAPEEGDQGKAETPAGLRQLEDLVETAEDYRRARQADPTLPSDLRLDSLAPVLSGEIPVLAVADELSQIQSAVAFAERHRLRLIIFGGYDAPQCAALLKRHQVPVIVGGVHRLPRNRSDHYDAPFTLPERLRQAGVTFCIAGDGRFGASNLRNLPYHAATAAAYGLPPAEALRAVTLYPAQIFGVAARVGSLEPGKDATLLVADGDILETPTLVERAWIQGREVSLNDRHKRLWHKYEQRKE